MFTPNTYPLKKSQFVDTYGFFTLSNDKSIFFDVPKKMGHGKIGKFKGLRVKLTCIYSMHYGRVIQIEPTNIKSTKKTKPLSLIEFNKMYISFASYQTWTNKKREAGKELFSFLRDHNPIYIQKEKNWIKQFNKYSRLGEFTILKIKSKSGNLSSFYGKNCLFVVTYNVGFKNGFLVLPIQE